VKILAVSDEVISIIYSPNIVSRFGDVDIVLACGDLPYSYMEFIASMLNAPCLFVHGNHDCNEHTECGIVLKNPGGWVDVDGRTERVYGLIVGGLQGSMRYRPQARFQHTEAEMALKTWMMAPRLMLNRLLRGRYLDILITHAPPRGIHDGQDLAHRGFRAFLDLMERFRPRYLLHGHQHSYYGRDERRTRYMDTEVINVHPYHVLEW
jgi:Icc-related predicted phosphoesterase